MDGVLKNLGEVLRISYQCVVTGFSVLQMVNLPNIGMLWVGQISAKIPRTFACTVHNCGKFEYFDVPARG